ncbi:MAG: MtrB/PioB family decaheme-associated outer membrane protein [Candidatus Methylumidiphilus sp.]
MVNYNFKLRAGVSAIFAAMLMGQTAIAAEATKHPTAKPAKATHATKKAKTSSASKSTYATKPAVVAPVAKPAVATPVTRAAETGASDSAALDELTKPQSYIEAGVLGVTESNWKYGQYNGLPNSGPYGIGNFDINGGGAYNSDDATRWRLTGKNIGLETREFTAEYKNQGKYKFNAGYNEIYRIGQGTYETPYIGAGGNQLNLPFNWQYPLNNNMRTLPQADRPLFQGVELSTKRRRVDGGFGYFFNNEWELKGSMRHEEKNGMQALGAPIVATRSVILPNPISQSTDQINASLNFTGEKAYGAFAYYGSIFHNDYNSVIFQNAYAAPALGNPKFGQMSTMPDNQFHQFTLSGGYNFSTDTKLVGSGAYGRNWQDQNFLPISTSTFAMPTQNNLNGGVDFKNVNVKLTHKATADLNLAASYKYDERENTTSVYTYQFPDVDTTGQGTNFRNNTPFSRRVQTGNLDASYTIAKGHALKFGYEIQNIDRWCNGTWTSCVDTVTTRENIGRIDYRGSLTDKINTKLGYAYSNRSADNYNQDSAYLASFQQPQTAAQWNLYNNYLAIGLPSWGPALPWPNRGVPYPFPNVYANNNPITTMVTGGGIAQDINGLGRFNTAPRNRQSFNSQLNYQATDKLGFGVNGDYRYDDYYQSTFGLQSSRNWSINFDSSYNFDENLSGHLFYTFQNIQNKTAGMSYGNNANTGITRAGSVIGGCVNNVLAVNNFAKTDPCRDWLSNMGNDINTVGLGLKHKGLFSSKLELNGDFLLSFARTTTDINGGQYVQSPTGTATNGPFYYIPAAGMPDVNTQMYQFKLDAKYNVSKASAAHLTYMFQHMWSNDYTYIGQQPLGTPTGVMPTFMQAPVYSVHAIGLSYIYNF